MYGTKSFLYNVLLKFNPLHFLCIIRTIL